MEIEDIKECERMTPHMRNVKPDEFERQGGWCADSRNLLAALRNLAPELIALWESVDVLCNPPADLPATDLAQLAVVKDCLNWLNDKASTI